MVENLHKRLASRLFFGFVVLSLVIGGVVLYLEIERVDSLVVGLTKEASRHLIESNSATLAHGEIVDVQALKQTAQAMIQDHFVVVEIYGPDKNQIIEEARADIGEDVERELDRIAHAFPKTDGTLYQKLLVGWRIYIRAVVPFSETGDRNSGYFEGVYRVDDQTMARIRTSLIHSLLIVVASVFATTLLLYPVILFLNRDLIRNARQLVNANLETMELLGNAIAKRDSDTDIHNYRVTYYAVRLAERIGLDKPAIRELIKGSFLHDVGKIGIPDAILLKPGRLTEEEFGIMKSHVDIGLDILGTSRWLEKAIDVVRYHHEKVDGSGYGQGLSGEDIPINARIFAIVDVFDALTSERPYKAPMPPEQALALEVEQAGRHFDPTLLAHFQVLALSLYAEVGQADKTMIRDKLSRVVQSYFL